MSKRTVILAVSLTLIAAGLLLSGYPLYLMVQGRLEQHRLEKEFQEYTVNPSLVTAQPGNQGEPAPGLPQWEKLPPTRLVIPAIDLDVQVVAVDDMGIFARKLSQPPSYYPQSAMPGETGNVLIAGHRGGPAGYFLDLDELESGDSIVLHAPGVSYDYQVERVFIVEPTEISVIAPLDYAALTLTTCQRVGRDPAARRLIVRARFVAAENTQPPED